MSALDAVRKWGGLILAGGASRRMGQDKALMIWRGRRAVDLAFALASDACQGPVLVAGRKYGAPFVADPQPFAGPVAGVMAGIEALEALGCDTVLILAVDCPTLRLADLSPLMQASGSGAAYEGAPLPMSLRVEALPKDAATDWPLKRLAAAAGLTILHCPQDVRRRVRGANTPAERIALMADADGA